MNGSDVRALHVAVAGPRYVHTCMYCGPPPTNEWDRIDVEATAGTTALSAEVTAALFSAVRFAFLGSP